ncbi:MAG: amidohydrolase family protein [Solirubrobacterales bacterium]
MSELLGYRAIDADNHYYETRDAFTRHIDPSMADKAVRVVEDEDGRDRILIGDEPFTFLTPHFETVAAPGALKEMLISLKSGVVGDRPTDIPIDPAFQDRDARLSLLDQQGLEATVMLPTLAVTVEHAMRRDVGQTYANLAAFNRWLDEDWGFAWRDRIFGVPLMSLLDIDMAVEQLDWALGRGARLVHLRPGPVNGRSPADPVFDPFWARVNEAGVAVAFHISESGYNELYSSYWGEQPNPPSHEQSAFQWACFFGDRPIMDTLSALILHNLFGRFPNVRVLSVENGSNWVPYLLNALDKMKGMGRNGPWLGGRVEGRPSEIFRKHVFVSPFHEEDVVGLTELIGPERVLFGSDYPHPEGLADPVEFARRLGSLDAQDVRNVMRENTAALLGLQSAGIG